MTELERACALHRLERFTNLSDKTVRILQLESYPQLDFACLLWDLQFYRRTAEELRL